MIHCVGFMVKKEFWHVQSGCTTSLTQGRYIWRHDKVLLTLADILDREHRKNIRQEPNSSKALTLSKKFNLFHFHSIFLNSTPFVCLSIWLAVFHSQFLVSLFFSHDIYIYIYIEREREREKRERERERERESKQEKVISLKCIKKKKLFHL